MRARSRTLRSIAATALAVGTALLAGSACSQNISGDTVIVAIWATAVAAAQQGDPAAVAVALEPAMRPEIFLNLSRGRRYEVADLYGQATEALGDWPAAHDAFQRATGYPQSTAEDWSSRLLTAVLVADSTDASYSLQHHPAGMAHVLSAYDVDMVRRLDQLVRDVPDRGADLAVGQALEAEDWTSPYAYQDPSDVWLDYAQALLGRGEDEQAARAARHITDPLVIMAMQADRRFDQIVATVPGLRDAHAAAERNLRRAQDFAELHPRLLAGRLAVVRALAILNRRGEARALLEETNASLAASSPRKPLFDDMHLVRVVHGWLSGLLLDTGRTDEVLAARLASANGDGDPYSAFDVARTYLYLGKPAEAWTWIQRAPLEGLGPAERMTVVMDRACIAAANGDSTAVTQAVDYLRAHETWSPLSLTRALICSGQLDRAEAVLVVQLGNSRTRLAALGDLQSTVETPNAPAFVRGLEGGMKDLAGRPKVKAAIDRVGRRQTFDLVAWRTGA